MTRKANRQMLPNKRCGTYNQTGGRTIISAVKHDKEGPLGVSDSYPHLGPTRIVDNVNVLAHIGRSHGPTHALNETRMRGGDVSSAKDGLQFVTFRNKAFLLLIELNL